jgi:hypothetical protein
MEQRIPCFRSPPFGLLCIEAIALVLKQKLNTNSLSAIDVENWVSLGWLDEQRWSH